jgi:hypothetical protein
MTQNITSILEVHQGKSDDQESGSRYKIKLAIRNEKIEMGACHDEVVHTAGEEYNQNTEFQALQGGAVTRSG